MAVISVILATFHSLAVLPQCLQSLERCSSADSLEVIFIDNDSRDSTWPWIQDYVARSDLPFLAVKTLRLSENKGYAYANNRALELASGDFLLLLNPDTVVGQDAIAACIQKMQQNPEVGAVGCRLELADGRLDRACRRSLPTLWNSLCRFTGLSFLFSHSRFFAGYNLSYLPERESYPVECLCGAFLLVTKAVYDKVGGLDEDYFMYGEDIDWCRRILKAGYSIWYEGTVTTIHLKGGNGGKRSARSLRYFYDAMWLYYHKNHARQHSRLVGWLLRNSLRALFQMHVWRNSVRDYTFKKRERHDKLGA